MDMKTSPLAALKDPSLLKTDALINGVWVAGHARFDVHDPATGMKLADVANLGADEAAQAVATAETAWKTWRATTAKARAAILMKWFRLLQDNADDLARIMTAEQGKPLAEAKGEVGYAASFIEWFAEEAKRVYGETIPTTDNNKRYLRGEIAHRVNLKFAPEIRFRVDERFDEAERIEKLLRTPEVQRDLKRDEEET